MHSNAPSTEPPPPPEPPPPGPPPLLAVKKLAFAKRPALHTHAASDAAPAAAVVVPASGHSVHLLLPPTSLNSPMLHGSHRPSTISWPGRQLHSTVCPSD